MFPGYDYYQSDPLVACFYQQRSSTLVYTSDVTLSYLVLAGVVLIGYTEGTPVSTSPLRRCTCCHPEPFAAAQGKLRLGSLSLGSEMLRCAQHDRAVRVTLINAILTARKTTCEEVNKSAL
jgi:hypothetical protein